MDASISIVIPLYNVAGYAKKAADSILSQAFQGLEVVLVDDGSTDGSLERFADSFAEAEPKAIRQKNQGPGGARNTGIWAAGGEYVMFMDADDFLLPNALSQICALIREESPDIVFGHHVLWTEEKGTVKTVSAKTVPPQEPQEVTEFIISKQPLVAWGPYKYICRLGFLLANGLFFETNRLCEDVKWTIDLLMAAEKNRSKISFLPKPFYAYNYRRPGSTMNTLGVRRLMDLNSVVSGLVLQFGHRPLICRALIRESFFYANEYCLLPKTDKPQVMESYRDILPLYSYSNFVFHRMAGKLRNPTLFFLFSAALFSLKILKRWLINIGWVLKGA